MRIAYLASKLTLPGASARDVDVAEHRQAMAVIRPALKARAIDVIELAWDEPGIEWGEFDAVVIGSTWDYCDRHDEFLARLDVINAQTKLFNSPEMVRWNSRKTYLRELQSKGVPVVPTRWIDNPDQAIDWGFYFEDLGTDSLVVKRQVGANSEGQFRLALDETAPEIQHPMMVQPFLDSIVKEGEYSLVFIDGEFSHALIKRPRSGDYRIQASYGGIEEAVTPAQAEIGVAAGILKVLSEMPLYARVDMIRGAKGTLELMELEMVEPFLYPLQSTRLGELLGDALKRRLT